MKIPAELFVSYAHQDESLKNELLNHLANLRRQQLILPWHDRDIHASDDWKHQIDSHLATADIILLLVSSDFIASDYCHEVEMRRAIERHEAGEARIIPVFLRQCDWQNAPFARYQALPTDAKPVLSSHWSSRDEAFEASST